MSYIQTCTICSRYVETDENVKIKDFKCGICFEIADNSFDITCKNCRNVMNIKGRQSHYTSDRGYVDFGADMGNYSYLNIGCNKCGNKIHVGC